MRMAQRHPIGLKFVLHKSNYNISYRYTSGELSNELSVDLSGEFNTEISGELGVKLSNRYPWVKLGMIGYRFNWE